MSSASQPQTSYSDPGPQDPAAEIRKLLLEQFAIRVDSADTELLQSGMLDSMALVQVILQLEQHFSVQLPVEELEIESFRSVAKLAELVASRTAARQNAA